MKRLKICMAGVVMLLSASAFSQTEHKISPLPLPPPTEMRTGKPVQPQKVTDPEFAVPPTPPKPPVPAPPPPPEPKKE